MVEGEATSPLIVMILDVVVKIPVSKIRQSWFQNLLFWTKAIYCVKLGMLPIFLIPNFHTMQNIYIIKIILWDHHDGLMSFV